MDEMQYAQVMDHGSLMFFTATSHKVRTAQLGIDAAYTGHAPRKYDAYLMQHVTR